METKPCTHPDHVDGQSCLDYAIGCHMLCECCMGEAKVTNWTKQSVDADVSVSYHVAKARQRQVPSSNWVVPDWE